LSNIKQQVQQISCYVLKSTTMKNKLAKPALKPGTPLFKLHIDSRTTIVVRTKKAMDMWMEKYPNAKLIAQ
jgi:hypothetical protein